MAFLSYLEIKAFFQIVFTYMINVSIKTIAKYHNLCQHQDLKLHFQVSNISATYILGICILKKFII